jgi:hypothetical protein
MVLLQDNDSDEYTVEVLYNLLVKRIQGVNKIEIDKRKLYSLVKVLCVLGFLIRVNKGLVVYNGL